AALGALALRRPQTRRVAPLLALAAGLLVLQVLLGALTVWKLLAPWTVTAHLLTGNSFAATLLVTALTLREVRAPARPPASPAARAATAAAAGLLAIQLPLRGLVAAPHAGLAGPAGPTRPAGRPFPPL